jgi:hypothetical protein
MSFPTRTPTRLIRVILINFPIIRVLNIRKVKFLDHFISFVFANSMCCPLARLVHSLLIASAVHIVSTADLRRRLVVWWSVPSVVIGVTSIGHQVLFLLEIFIQLFNFRCNFGSFGKARFRLRAEVMITHLWLVAKQKAL